jgi:hypothetical protein
MRNNEQALSCRFADYFCLPLNGLAPVAHALSVQSLGSPVMPSRPQRLRLNRLLIDWALKPALL